MKEGMMNAVIINEYGGPEVLHYTEVPRPEPGPGEALVKVHAVGINAADIMARQGRYKPNPGFPHILGIDFSGEVIKFGPNIDSPLLGKRVIAWWAVPCGHCEQCIAGHPNRCALDYKYLGAHLPGAYAQYVKLPAWNLVPMPDNMTWEEGAAFPNPYGTAWHMLITRADLKPGETILIQAAGSGVSTAGIQIAKLVGAHVFATAGAGWKLDRAKALGADEVIDYAEADFQKEIMRLTGKRGVDVVFEHVGGDVLDKSIRSLTRGGRLVTSGGTAGYEVRINVSYIFHKELTIIGSNGATKRELEVMMPYVEDGKLKPVVDKTFPLPEVADAHRYLSSRRNFGKVVLRVDH